jgi:Tyrosyl-DNA phosphodiesterase
MEEERLARLRLKRRAEEEPQSEHLLNRAKRRESPVKMATVTNLHLEPSKPVAITGSDNVSKSTATQSLQFPQGTIRRTFSAFHPRDNDIKIEEVLLKDQLKIGVFSSFMWDMDWLISKLNVRDSRFWMAMMAPTSGNIEKHKAEWEKDAPPNVRLFWPPMEGVGNMHSKLMLLVYPKVLRIVITSANLTKHDWGESGLLENSVFLIDLPRLEQAVSRESLTYFGKELLHFLEKSKAPDEVIRGILKFDFSATADIAFVHSVGGSSFGSNMNRTGLNSLASAVQHLNLKPTNNEDLYLEYATASLGSLNDGLLHGLHNAARGILDKGTAAKPKSSTLSDSKTRDFARVYFPTKATVESSLGGPDAAGTICLRESWYRKSTFPRDVLRDHISTRQGLLSHSKIILGHTASAAWVYVGSHNLSEAAWGKVSKDRQRNEYKMVCRNWECGVLVPVKRSANQTSSNGAGSERQPDERKDLRQLFQPLWDIPFEIPGQPHRRDPWFFENGGHGFG